MKSIIYLLIFVSSMLAQSQNTSVYDVAINSLNGKTLDLITFKGKKILFVNVASKCGYTPQYKALQKLHQTHKDKIIVVGVPCNQFGGQEPGSPSEIMSFCESNYGVDFQLTEKIDVKGNNQHPLYKWLTSKSLNGKADSDVKWNFQKYLVSEHGELLEIFPSATDPMSDEIIKLL